MKRLLVFALALVAGMSLRATEDHAMTALVRKADKLILYSLVPSTMAILDENGHRTGEYGKLELLHEFPVLGEIADADPKTQEAIRAAVLITLTDIHDIGPQASTMCFDPRHAVRIQKGERKVDLLICYECRAAYAFYTTEGKEQQRYVDFGPAGREAFNQLLDSHKIPRDIPAHQEHSR